MTLSRAPDGEADGSDSAENAPVGAPVETRPPLIIEATPLGVRAALKEMRARFGSAITADGTLGMAETVLAEVLNNIVEHAYARDRDGPIELRLAREGVWLQVDVRDYGLPMPGESLPDGRMPGPDVLADDVPEGGFGWFLIRAFARNLDYTRKANQNRLTFSVPLSEEP
ncbi:hypothetical protein BYZ73_02530 [Rhodovulum viride]|uniref:Histidine kinase/HSP90-like ATPase domain-containing protein n=1 Tax=Rhodovulum viride TaxID=1231134 RepID=A0ABX9DNX1_9RHOB|nr:ATP-binding protein [Rhodovulum viride]RAP43071.1 hypothetical protein BYZ73_02530 [Rhodovulum viride]